MAVAAQLAAWTYIAMAVFVVIVEFSPWRKPAVVSAYASILFAAMGSTAWCYAAFYSPSEWGDLERPQKTASHSGAKKHAGHNGGSVEDDEGDDEEGRDKGKDSKGANSGGLSQVSNGAMTYLDDTSRSLARATGHALGIGNADDDDGKYSGAIVKDCEDCPELITIRPGSAVIGANETDAEAKGSERPARLQKFWPGFRIGREAISQASFDRFLDETGRAMAACPNAGPAPSLFARCLSAADADAYVSWLSGITGKRFRLATAAEWEFAAKTAVTPVADSAAANPAQSLRLGDVREMVADCWRPYLPSLDKDVLAASAGPFTCDSRMAKGWSESDAVTWKRLSARREITNGDANAVTGLRVVRELN